MPDQQRPNLIWVFGDQHRGQSMGYAGDPNVCTPNVDRLAAEGLRLDGVAGFPLCCPYRGSLISGVYPHQCVPGHQYPLPADQQTVAHAFAEAGYRTLYIGKWHLGGWEESKGRAALYTVPRELRGGFETWIGYENNNAQWECFVHGHDGDEEVERYALRGYETDALTDLFLDQLRDAAADDRPFFAVLSVQPPHNPYVAPPEWMRSHTPGQVVLRPNVPDVPHVTERARRELAGYHAMIENLDWNFGRIRDALFSLGIDGHTHSLFFSDHGDMHGSHGQFLKTCPWEEAIRVPMVLGGMSLYGYKRGASPALVNHVDIAPTSLGLCGIEPAEWMQGTDYSHHRLPGKQPRTDDPDSAYIQQVVPTGHGDSIDRPYRGIVTRDGWKYVCLEHQPWLLFNLNDDPYEQVNLAHNTRYRAQRKRLNERLRAWVNDTGDEFALPEV